MSDVASRPAGMTGDAGRLRRYARLVLGPKPDGLRARQPAVVGQTLWFTGWRRTAFCGIWLVYLVATGSSIATHASGSREALGFALLAGFCLAYLYAFPNPVTGNRPGFEIVFGAMWVAYLLEIPIARAGSGAMATYLVVIGIFAFGRRFIPFAAGLAVLTLLLPTFVSSWHASLDTGSALAIATVTLAMYGFFRLVRANIELTEARAEVARLAAENERTRIARDLHDLLGHSLTTITVKAGLARRLAGTDPTASIREITEVEELGRRSLAEVRATVSGYREATLAGELASARELLRAAGIEAELPATVEAVPPAVQQVFAWVLREAMTNVVRHSHASHASVTLDGRRLEIVDDGAGAPAEDGRSAGGSGLRGLRERVEAAGGRLEAGPAHAADGTGWRVLVELPPGVETGAGPASAAGCRPTVTSDLNDFDIFITPEVT